MKTNSQLIKYAQFPAMIVLVALIREVLILLNTDTTMMQYWMLSLTLAMGAMGLYLYSIKGAKHS